MCFIQENKYFIQHNFNSRVKGLSERERNEHYGTIRLEVRQRLKTSLQGCINKSKFYHEAFDILADFETDYLFLNLFFESDFITIINSLHQASILDKLRFKDANSIAAKYHSHVIAVLNTKKIYTDNDAVIFLESAFLNLVPVINIHDWRAEDESNSPVISKYTQWVFSNLSKENNIDNVFQSFILFVKFWNYFEFINKVFNKKAILFYSLCIAEFEKISDPIDLIKVYRNLSKLRSKLSALFVNIQYIPLQDTKNSGNYKQGYLIKRNLFLDKLKESEKLISISETSSILALFRTIKVSENEVYFENAKRTLQRKIDNLELPSYEEILKIKNLELSGNADVLRKYLFQRLYLFEFV